MTNAQTEARAIAPMTLEGAIWHYMDEKTVAAYGPWVTKADHDAALAAKDAELVTTRQELGETRLVLEQTERNAHRLAEQLALAKAEREFWREAAARDQAQLAEARKALNYLNDAIEVGLPDQEISRRAQLLAAAIRALEAQGGKNG